MVHGRSRNTWNGCTALVFLTAHAIGCQRDAIPEATEAHRAQRVFPPQRGETLSRPTVDHARKSIQQGDTDGGTPMGPGPPDPHAHPDSLHQVSMHPLDRELLDRGSRPVSQRHPKGHKAERPAASPPVDREKILEQMRRHRSRARAARRDGDLAGTLHQLALAMEAAELADQGGALFESTRDGFWTYRRDGITALYARSAFERARLAIEHAAAPRVAKNAYINEILFCNAIRARPDMIPTLTRRKMTGQARRIFRRAMARCHKPAGWRSTTKTRPDLRRMALERLY